MRGSRSAEPILRPSPARRLCAAIVDRLTDNGHIIETATTSYRLGHARRQRESR